MNHEHLNPIRHYEQQKTPATQPPKRGRLAFLAGKIASALAGVAITMAPGTSEAKENVPTPTAHKIEKQKTAFGMVASLTETKAPDTRIHAARIESGGTTIKVMVYVKNGDQNFKITFSGNGIYAVGIEDIFTKIQPALIKELIQKSQHRLSYEEAKTFLENVKGEVAAAATCSAAAKQNADTNLQLITEAMRQQIRSEFERVRVVIPPPLTSLLD